MRRTSSPSLRCTEEGPPLEVRGQGEELHPGSTPRSTRPRSGSRDPGSWGVPRSCLDARLLAYPIPGYSVTPGPTSTSTSHPRPYLEWRHETPVMHGTPVVPGRTGVGSECSRGRVLQWTSTAPAHLPPPRPQVCSSSDESYRDLSPTGVPHRSSTTYLVRS